MDIQSAIKKVIERQDLSADEMNAVMRIIMTGEAMVVKVLTNRGVHRGLAGIRRHVTALALDPHPR